MASQDIVAELIKDTPPTEFKEVYHDIQQLLGAEELSNARVMDACREYHERHLTTVQVPGTESTSLVSEYTRLPDGRYFDCNIGKSFEFDPISMAVSNVEDYESPGQEERSGLLNQIRDYAQDHLCERHSVQVVSREGTEIMILVGTRSNPASFWSGRWRSIYTFDGSSLTGRIHIDIHYYEDGNVRFTSSKPMQSATSRTQIGATIAKWEQDFHESVLDEFDGLNEGAFKSLRRQLPITRQRMDWQKIAQYRIGAHLSAR